MDADVITMIRINYLPSSMHIGSGSHLGAVALHRPELRHVLSAG